MSDTTIIKLVNPEFDIEYCGTTYRIRKATLDKAIQYQQKVKELQGDPAADSKLISFCLYIMLKDKIPDLTLESVSENIQADIDVFATLATLGFMSPRVLETAKKIQEATANNSTSAESLPS